MKIVHKPLVSNYSHFEFDFDFFELETNIVTKPSENSWKKVIVAELRQWIIKNARFTIEDF